MARTSRARCARSSRPRRAPTCSPRSSTARSWASRAWSPTRPAARPLGGRPQITVASDLHNNLLAVPALQRVARGTPLFFVGDLTDRGTPLEAQLTSGILHAGTRLVFVTGNHDSDSEAQELADDGAIVLTEHGRLLRGGRYGPMVVARRRAARGRLRRPLPPPARARVRPARHPARAVGGRAEPVRRVAAPAGGQGRRRHGPRAGAGRARRSTRCAATRRRIRSCCSSATRTSADIEDRPRLHAAQRRDGRRRRDGQPQRGGEDRRGADDLRRQAARSRRWRPTSWRSIPATARRRRSASGSTSRPRSKVANSVDRPSRRARQAL